MVGSGWDRAAVLGSTVLSISLLTNNPHAEGRPNLWLLRFEKWYITGHLGCVTWWTRHYTCIVLYGGVAEHCGFSATATTLVIVTECLSHQGGMNNSSNILKKAMKPIKWTLSKKTIEWSYNFLPSLSIMRHKPYHAWAWLCPWTTPWNAMDLGHLSFFIRLSPCSFPGTRRTGNKTLWQRELMTTC